MGKEKERHRTVKPATWKIEARRSQVQGPSGQLKETLSHNKFVEKH